MIDDAVRVCVFFLFMCVLLIAGGSGALHTGLGPVRDALGSRHLFSGLVLGFGVRGHRVGQGNLNGVYSAASLTPGASVSRYLLMLPCLSLLPCLAFTSLPHTVNRCRHRRRPHC